MVDAQLLWWVFLYVSGSTTYSLILGKAALLGLAHPQSFLMLVAHYAGMAIGGLALERQERGSGTHRSGGGGGRSTMFFMGAGHLLAMLVLVCASYLAGPATVALVYSVSPAITACMGYIMMGKRVTGGQIVSLGAIIGGLLLTVKRDGDTGPVAEGATGASTEYQLGVVTTVLCAVIFNVVNLNIERIMKGADPPSPGSFLTRLSANALGLAAGIVAFWTVPRWATLVAPGLRRGGGTTTELVACVASYALAVCAQNYAYFVIAKKSGVMLLSVLYGLNTVMVLTLSHVLFCSEAQPLQCGSPALAFGAAVVVAGIIGYGLTGAKASAGAANTKGKEKKG